MFGYIRAYKPYMRVFEYDIYKAVYCGLCKDMGRRYGFISRFTLSYDFAFLALCDFSCAQHKLCASAQRCIAHPWKKTFCAGKENDYKKCSACAVILTYHKLMDDREDKGIKKKAAACICLFFFRRYYKKAKKVCPELAKEIEGAMKLQREVESENCMSIDRACEPTAMMMKSVFSQFAEEGWKRQNFGRFGYLLGRFIYICDALDDLEKDGKEGSYNPFLNNFTDEEERKNIPGDKLEKIRRYADDSVNFTLGELAEVYIELDFKMYRDILDNIIYLGLKNVYNSIKRGELKKRYKKSLS